MNIKIFVFQHFPCRLPNCFADDSIYVPMQCGRAINAAIPGTIGDDTGDNISRLNDRYNEMTAIYWVTKHYEELGNPEYVGFDHYRRFLNWNEDMLAPRSVVARRWFSWRPLRDQYVNCHGAESLDLFSSVLAKYLSDDEQRDYKAYWKTHFFYICNLFVMHRDNFRRYAEFILRCIDVLREIDRSKPGAANCTPRTPGFILERMTSYWIWREQRKNAIDIVPSTVMHFDIHSTNGGSACLNKHSFLWFLRQAY